MSNDPLTLPQDAAGSAGDADYRDVYAALAATERGRSFLDEHARRHGQPDARRLFSTVARLEAMVHDDLSSDMMAACARGVADLAAAIVQIETALADSELAAADGMFAAERVQDVVLALRHHRVAAALCDALDVGIRELGDAVVNGKAATKRALGAAALARDLARRLNEMIVLRGAAQPGDTAQSGDSVREQPALAAGHPAADDGPYPPSPPPSAPTRAAASVVPAEDRHGSRGGEREPEGLPAFGSARPRADDSLAAIVALSEEELIALFS